MKFRPGILVAAMAVTLLPTLTWAQTPVTFGVKAGVNSSTLSVEDNSGLETSRIWGAVAGVFLGANVNDNLSVQVEGLFSQRGAKDTSTPSTTKIRLTYLDVPVVVRLGNTTTSGTHFHVFTGPQLSLKLKAEGINDVFGTEDLDEEVESMDFGWTLGAGVERNRLSLDGRYTFGLKNISVAPSDGTFKNRTFTILVGYRLK